VNLDIRSFPDMTIRRVTNLAFCCAAGVALLLATSAHSQDRGGEVDPGTVSAGLKAIFSYSSSNKSTRERLNANTVTLMSGTIGGTYVQFGADLASALDDGDEMRVLPIIGRGSVQSIADILS
jgi:TRAP-type uncharacterized transport system substrate-binding protein